jgi:glycosyltransferase involved in cell wall biosynthesis
MLVENSYPDDTRVRNEANLLVSAGYRVSVVASRYQQQPTREVIDGVQVYRLPRLELFQKTAVASGLLVKFLLKLRSAIGYCTEYVYLTMACTLVAFYVFLKEGFDVIHTHNPPDTLFLVALPYRLIGKKYVFDHHDLCPELYLSRFRGKHGVMARILTFLEWCSLRLANITIATNESYKETQIRRAGKRPETIFVVRNGPSEARMTLPAPTPRLRALNRQILVYIGALNPQDGVDYLLRALHHLIHELHRTDFYCVIMGSGDSLGDLRALAKQLQLDDFVELTGYISEEDLRANLAAADICMDPDPSSPLNDVSTWIKIMEYMAAAKPIVTFDLKETRFSAQDAAVYVQPNDEHKFAAAIAGLLDDPAARARMGAAGRARVEKDLQWSVVGQSLLAAYAFLLPRRQPTGAAMSEVAR